MVVEYTVDIKADAMSEKALVINEFLTALEESWSFKRSLVDATPKGSEWAFSKPSNDVSFTFAHEDTATKFKALVEGV